ncbi:MAG TPA: TraM recognition domain-containing protein [Verrucomicrobiae bacterium]|nr:TraM recognition domain-containing protein [Verrucomicrobiae bacterium]
MIKLRHLLRPRRPQGNSVPPPLPARPWDLDSPLLYLSSHTADAWRIRDACEGIQIFGATGSGKTSGSGHALARAFLENGFGGLVLCAKTDEPELWLRYAQETGRTSDLILLSRERFNFLHYEANRPGAGAGQTENLVTLFMQVAEIANQRHGYATADLYWERAVKQMLRNAIDLLTIASGAVSLPELFEIVRTAPQDSNEVASAAWKSDSICFDYIQKAGDNATKNPNLQPEYAMAAKYWLEEFPRMDNRPRSSIVSLFTTLADCFLRGELRKLFSTDTTVIPDHATLGRIIIVDLPVKEWGELGQYAAVLMKFMTQKALERRPSYDERPVFIWADEAHYFASDYDQIFQTTARSSRACTVYLTQNYSNYLSALGGEAARPKVDSLLGNLQTKIFHQNGDTVTNQWAAELIGRKLQYRFNSSSSETYGIGQASSTTTEGEQQVIDLEVQPREFTLLWKGGTEYQCLTRAILFQGGRIWGNGKTWKHVVFQQT